MGNQFFQTSFFFYPRNLESFLSRSGVGRTRGKRECVTGGGSMEETEVRKSGDGPCLYAHPCSLTLAKTEFQFFNPAKLLAPAAGARKLSSSTVPANPLCCRRTRSNVGRKERKENYENFSNYPIPPPMYDYVQCNLPLFMLCRRKGAKFPFTSNYYEIILMVAWLPSYPGGENIGLLQQSCRYLFFACLGINFLTAGDDDILFVEFL